MRLIGAGRPVPGVMKTPQARPACGVLGKLCTVERLNPGEKMGRAARLTCFPIYNYQRPHQSLNYRTPTAVHFCTPGDR